MLQYRTGSVFCLSLMAAIGLLLAALTSLAPAVAQVGTDDTGYIDGTRFYHPVLGVQFEAEPGLTLTNRPDAVTVSGAAGVAIFSSAPYDGNLEVYAKGVFDNTFRNSNVTNPRSLACTHNQFRCVRFSGTYRVNGQKREASVYAFEYDKTRAYHIVTATVAGPNNLMSIPRTFARYDASKAATPASTSQAANAAGVIRATVSPDRCVVEVVVANPEMWLDDARMTQIAAQYGRQALEGGTCPKNFYGRSVKYTRVWIRQAETLPQKAWDGPCPAGLPESRKWMCSSAMGIVSGGILQNALGDFSTSAGAGVVANFARFDGTANEWTFGGRAWTHVDGPYYLYDYQNSALKTKLAYDQTQARNRAQANAERARADHRAAAVQLRQARMAAFTKQALGAFPAGRKSLATLAVKRSAEACFPEWYNNEKPYAMECKDFILTSLTSKPLTRADVANGIREIVHVRARTLARTSVERGWSERCDSDEYVLNAAGNWTLRTPYQCR